MRNSDRRGKEVRECVRLDCCDTARQHKILQCTGFKSTSANDSDGVRKDERSQTGTSATRAIRNLCEPARKPDISQAATLLENSFSERCDIIGNRDGNQTVTIRKSLILYLRKSATDMDTCQIMARREGIFPNGNKVVACGQRCDTPAATEC